MKLLSVHDGHNASAALLEDGNVLSAVSEERLNREKFYWGFPKRSVDFVLDDTNSTLADIDVVTVSHLDGWGYIKRRYEIGGIRGFLSLRPKFLFGNMLNIFRAFRRERTVRALFKKVSKTPKFYFCDHHTAHAASAYYHSGFEKALVVTIDALGDSLSHTAWVAEGEQWTKLVQGGTGESLGTFYEQVTKGLGFKPNRHEGKVVGLAAYASPNKAANDAEERFVSLSEDGLHFARKNAGDMEAAVHELLKTYSREEIASWAQHKLENLVVQHVSVLLNKTDTRNLAVAGGVFANVKMNQRVVEQCGIKQFFVQPAMGDEGLVLGSALHYINVIAKKTYNTALRNIYFGSHYENEEIEEFFKAENMPYRTEKNMAQHVAALLDDGKIIGWFDERMEFGPRALGHRSILVRPTDASINDELNKRLKRSEFMPFAPSVLYEEADTLFENVAPSRHAAEFMTITYNVRTNWSEKIAAVVHVDGTARPQLVRKEVNPTYHDVIAAYYKRTGIPCVVNTSFNMHEEPIVATPNDALRSFRSGAVDVLVFNNTFLVEKA